MRAITSPGATWRARNGFIDKALGRDRTVTG
jgi:hypothetical protein